MSVYARPAMGTATPKPVKGDDWKRSRQRRAERRLHERKQMDAAKRRDGNKCRVPRCEHAPRSPRIEPAHYIHRGMGGNPSGDRTERALIVSLCFLHHADYDWKTNVDLEIEPQTSAMFDGPCAYYFRAKGGEFVHYATEKVIGISTAVGA